MKRHHPRCACRINEEESCDCGFSLVVRLRAEVRRLKAERRELRAACAFFNFPDYPEGHLSDGENACTRALSSVRGKR